MRPDVSEKLIHFTKGESWDHAFGTLLSILTEGVIRGDREMIKGGYDCVCFTESAT